MLKIRKYCLVRDSEDLRELVKLKMKQQGYNTRTLGEALELDKGNINQWLSGLATNQLRQFDVIRIARLLGIEVSLKIDIRK